MRAEVSGRREVALASYRRALRLFLGLDPRVIGGIPEATDRVRELEQRISAIAGSFGPEEAA